MQLAKPCIDIGVHTNNLEAMLDFWTGEIGLAYEELLKVGGGVHQHRLSLRGAVFKLNHSREPLPQKAPSGYRELLIAADVDSPRQLTDPDGNKVMLVPLNHQGVTHIGMVMSVTSAAQTADFFCHALEAEPLGEDRFRWGTTVFIVRPDAQAPGGGMHGRGYRYLTVQVYKTDSEHQALLERGAVEGRAPNTLGSTARISFVTDPDNNWIEISQRASLTGDLEPG